MQERAQKWSRPMFVEDFPSEGGERDATKLGEIRVDGGLSIKVAQSGGISRITDLEERGGYRAKFPNGGAGVDAISINTGGGLVGGDNVTVAIDVGDGAAMTFATQSAERVYRALSAAVRTNVQLTLAPRASLHWLPQETILFNGAKLKRSIKADMAKDATLLLSEAVVFGREAMGEDVHNGAFHDRWIVMRDGTPAYVEAVAFEGDLHTQMQQRAVGAAARAAATVVFIAPDAEERRDAAREALVDARGRAAVSAWNGMLVGRFLAPSAAALRKDLTALLTCLSRAPLPRVWNC